MEQERIVSLEEVKNVMASCIEELSSKSIPLSYSGQLVSTLDKNELSEKDKKVLAHIKNNPGIIKQEVVDVFENEPGYSRRVIFHIFRRLKKLNLIMVEPDHINSQYHHLFVNDVNMLVSLITILEYFKKLYFELVYKTKPLLGEKIVQQELPMWS
jgi:hypothetical protein